MVDSLNPRRIRSSLQSIQRFNDSTLQRQRSRSWKLVRRGGFACHAEAPRLRDEGGWLVPKQKRWNWVCILFIIFASFCWILRLSDRIFTEDSEGNKGWSWLG
jgi:hypothetical protein